MKKLLFLLSFAVMLIFINQTIQAQTRYTKLTPAVSATVIQDTIKGIGDTVSFISPPLDDYYDLVSCQLNGVLYLAGDSVRSSVQFYQSNSVAYLDWVELAAKADTLQTVGNGAIFNDDNFEGMYLRAKATGISTDTVIVRVYWVRKKDKVISF